MATSKATATRQSVWTAVFRRIVKQVKNDADIKRVFGDQVRSWEGSPDDKNPFVPTLGRPILRLTPQPGHVDWYSPDSQMGILVVVVEIAIQSLCVDDVQDCYDLLVTALRPSAGTFAQELVALGAETGEILFDDPAYDPKPDGSTGQFMALGQFKLDVLRSV